MGRQDEMVGWHHWLNGHELEQTQGDSEGQGSLACCSSWGCREPDNWTTTVSSTWINFNNKMTCKTNLQNYVCNDIYVKCKHLQYNVLFIDIYIWGKSPKKWKKDKHQLQNRGYLCGEGNEIRNHSGNFNSIHKILFLCQRIRSKCHTVLTWLKSGWWVQG